MLLLPITTIFFIDCLNRMTTSFKKISRQHLFLKMSRWSGDDFYKMMLDRFSL